MPRTTGVVMMMMMMMTMPSLMVTDGDIAATFSGIHFTYRRCVPYEWSCLSLSPCWKGQTKILLLSQLSSSADSCRFVDCFDPFQGSFPSKYPAVVSIVIVVSIIMCSNDYLGMNH
jgi:hypothetical protein